MQRELLLFQTDENEYRLRALGLLCLVPPAIALVTHQISERVDLPLLSEGGYGLARQDYFYLSDENLTNSANEWNARVANVKGLDQPYVARATLPVESTTNTAGIAESLVASAKTMVENLPKPLLLDAFVYDPNNSKIQLYAPSESPANDKDAATPANTDKFVYYKVISGVKHVVGEDGLLKDITQRFEQSNAWRGGSAAPNMIPYYQGELIIPYTTSQYTAMFNLAQANGYANIEFMSASLAEGKNEPLRHKAEAILKNSSVTANGLDKPAVILRATLSPLENPQGGSTPHTPDPAAKEVSQQVCEIQTRPISETYHILHANQVSNPISVTAFTMLATLGIIWSRVEGRRRRVGDIEVPTQDQIESAKNGTAPTADKLQVLAYFQAVEKKGQEPPYRKVSKGWLRPLAYVSLVGSLSGALMSGPAYLASRHTPSAIATKAPVTAVEDCPPNLPVALNVAVTEKPVSRTFYVKPEDLPSILKNLPAGGK